MASFTTQNKPSAASWNNQNEASAATWNSQIKGGYGWTYDQTGITYDGLTDPASGNTVLYDSLGTLPIWTNQPKSP